MDDFQLNGREGSLNDEGFSDTPPERRIPRESCSRCNGVDLSSHVRIRPVNRAPLARPFRRSQPPAPSEQNQRLPNTRSLPDLSQKVVIPVAAPFACPTFMPPLLTSSASDSAQPDSETAQLHPDLAALSREVALLAANPAGSLQRASGSVPPNPRFLYNFDPPTSVPASAVEQPGLVPRFFVSSMNQMPAPTHFCPAFAMDPSSANFQLDMSRLSLHPRFYPVSSVSIDPSMAATRPIFTGGRRQQQRRPRNRQHQQQQHHPNQQQQQQQQQQNQRHQQRMRPLLVQPVEGVVPSSSEPNNFFNPSPGFAPGLLQIATTASPSAEGGGSVYGAEALRAVCEVSSSIPEIPNFSLPPELIHDTVYEGDYDAARDEASERNFRYNEDDHSNSGNNH